jgi:hypothetical protein
VRILLGLIFCTVLASAQTPAAEEITQEPHHHLLLQNDQVRVFEVTLRPSEHFLVKHQYNFLVVTLQDCEMVMWNEGESEIASFRFGQGDVHFFYSGAARGMRNDHTGMYRNITVEFLNAKVTTFGYQANTGKWEYGGSAIGPPVDPNKKFHTTLQLGVADASDVQLLQRDVLEPPAKGTFELLIPVTDLDVTHGSDLHVRKNSGEAWWIGGGRKADLMNTSIDPARFVLVELKASQN